MKNSVARTAWKSAARPPATTRDSNGTAKHNLSFNVTAPGGYRLDIHQDRVGIIQRNSDGVLVQGDVAAGDRVVTQGVLALSNGAEVRLLDDNVSDAEAAADGANPGSSL